MKIKNCNFFSINLIKIFNLKILKFKKKLKISTLLRNPNVADSERWERVTNLYGEMDGNLRDEFENKFKNFGNIDSNQ